MYKQNARILRIKAYRSVTLIELVDGWEVVVVLEDDVALVLVDELEGFGRDEEVVLAAGFGRAGRDEVPTSHLLLVLFVLVTEGAAPCFSK